METANLPLAARHRSGPEKPLKRDRRIRETNTHFEAVRPYRLEFDRAPQRGGEFTYAAQPEAGRLLPFGIESAPVIPHRAHNRTLRSVNPDHHMGGSGVAHHVRERRLSRAVKGPFERRVETPPKIVVELHVHPAARRKTLTQA